MAKIVYIDRDKSAPYVRFHGFDFTHGQEVDVEDDRDELIAMAEANPYFHVVERQEDLAEPPPAPRAKVPERKRRAGA